MLQSIVLYLIATSLGNPKDITLRAIEALREADIVIGEEQREVSKLLKSLAITGKRMELLNEHSRESDVQDLLALCRQFNVALVTDCGTPGFCDPGARLVAACRAAGLTSSPVPGASSLMCLLSVAGVQMTEFLFRGFLPAEREARSRALQELARERRPVILMDTPYRLERLLSELTERFPDRRALLGCDFTQPSELIVEAKLSELPALVGERKAEFILAIFPTGATSTYGAGSGRAAPGAGFGGGAKRSSEHLPSRGSQSGSESGKQTGAGSSQKPAKGRRSPILRKRK